MAIYRINKETLVKIADGIRAVFNKTDDIKVNNISDEITSIENAVNTQADLISQISAVLDNKTSGESGSSGGGTSFKTCTISGLSYYGVYYTTVEDGEIVCKSEINYPDFDDTITVLCDSIIYYAKNEKSLSTISLSGGFELLYDAGYCKYLVIKAPSYPSNGAFLEEEVEIPDL